MLSGLFSGHCGPALASLTDGLAQIVGVAALTGICVVGGVVWLAKKRWEPALQQVATLVEREVRQAERSAQALRAGMQAQAQRAQRQASSMHGAIAGVRALQCVTEDLDQCASDLKHLAQVLASDSGARRPSQSITDHVVASAKQVAMTAEQAHQVYRRLQASVNQLVAEANGLVDLNQEAEQHAQELTGMMDRLRQGVRRKHGRSREAHQEEREESPARLPLPARREMERRPAPDWRDIDAPREGERRRAPDWSPPRDGVPAPRPQPGMRRRADVEEREMERVTHRRDDPDSHYATRAPERPSRAARDDDDWLDYDAPSPNRRNSRRRREDDRW